MVVYGFIRDIRKSIEPADLIVPWNIEGLGAQITEVLIEDQGRVAIFQPTSKVDQ